MTEFKKYLQSKNINPTSIQKYIVQVEKFKTYLAKDLDSVEKKDVLNYLQFLQENKNLSNRTRQQTLGILRHYYNHIQIPNPTNLLNIRGTKKKILYKILSEWKAIKIEDIDLIKGTIFIKSTRKSNQRKLSLQASQLGFLYAFLKDRNDTDNLLFTSTPELQKWAKKLRKLYPKYTDFKQIRASIITYWIQTEGLRKAQYKAGHRYISSTESYLSNDLESLKDDISQFHPL